jgi:endonuclease/exonuclease/phosphatase family metal-dependent hydrolase
VSSSRWEWAIAGAAVGWALARLAAVDRFRPTEHLTVPLLALTPQAAAAAALAALTLRGNGSSAATGLAAAAMGSVVARRAIPRRQPAAQGPALRVLTVNLLGGGAAGPELVELVRWTDADVLFLQELSDDALTRLKRLGLDDLLPHQMLQVDGFGNRGSGIYARYPLAGGLPIAVTEVSQPSARLDLPGGRSVQLICAHPYPPAPPWHRYAAARWRDELSVLPPPGDPPVVLAGDFNATLDHAQFRRLLRLGHVDAASQVGNGLELTWGPEPTGNPALLTVDHVLVDPRCAVLATSVHRLPGSDHQALHAEFRLPA